MMLVMGIVFSIIKDNILDLIDFLLYIEIIFLIILEYEFFILLKPLIK